MLFAAMLFTACSSDDPVMPEPEQPTDDRVAVSIMTRTNEGNQGEQVQAGLFMVNYRNGRSDNLLPAYNYVNNQLLTWSNSGWTTDTPIYWNDSETPADFYAYAPYQASIADARKMDFSVQTDQSTAAAFAQSDFLWGSVQGQSPSAEGFNLTLSHKLCQLTIQVTADTGFEENELQSKDVTVTFGGSKTHCLIDLSTGATTVTGAANDVKCMNNGDLSFKAVLIPQQVPFSDLIKIDWKGNVYTLQNSFKLEAERQYTLTVKLKKSKSGFDVGIEGWDIIGEDFGGVIGGS